MTRRSSNRRDFLKQTVLSGAGFWLAGHSPAVARSPNEKLNLAIIGAGGRGAANTEAVQDENIVALCDVEETNLGRAAEKHSKARTYRDFRKLFDQAKDIDAVVVSTTEHTHAFATLAALQLGKHVYCEKPLCHSIWETRRITEAAAKAKVATQMGTQIHAGDNYRRVVELVQANAIGPITECHVWVARDWGGGARPTETLPVPKTLDWDLWLGPAPERPYHSEYVPGPKWYKWWDFGNGTMSDLGAHWIDLPFWALQLHQPLSAEAEGPPVSSETAPKTLVCRWEFAARSDDLPAVKLAWYHGGKKPDLVTQKKVPAWDSGCLFVGARGMILSNYDKHLLLPEKEFADFERPKPTIAKSLGHHAEWIEACKTGKPTTCHFGYGGPLVESNLVGVLAYRLGRRIEWDPVHLKAKNCPEAERIIRREYRKGWSLV
jgi:predicted dehydrogenase